MNFIKKFWPVILLMLIILAVLFGGWKTFGEGSGAGASPEEMERVRLAKKKKAESAGPSDPPIQDITGDEPKQDAV